MERIGWFIESLLEDFERFCNFLWRDLTSVESWRDTVKRFDSPKEKDVGVREGLRQGIQAYKELGGEVVYRSRKQVKKRGLKNPWSHDPWSFNPWE